MIDDVNFCTRDSSESNFSEGYGFFLPVFWNQDVFPLSPRVRGSMGLVSAGSTLTLRVWSLGVSYQLLLLGWVLSFVDHQTQSSLDIKPTDGKRPQKNSSRPWLTSLISLRFCLVFHHKLVRIQRMLIHYKHLPKISSFQEDAFRKMLIRNFTPKDWVY